MNKLGKAFRGVFIEASKLGRRELYCYNCKKFTLNNTVKQELSSNKQKKLINKANNSGSTLLNNARVRFENEKKSIALVGDEVVEKLLNSKEPATLDGINRILKQLIESKYCPTEEAIYLISRKYMSLDTKAYTKQLIKAIVNISLLESNSIDAAKHYQPFYDKIEDFYDRYFKQVNTQLYGFTDVKSLTYLLTAAKKCRYYDSELFKQAATTGLYHLKKGDAAPDTVNYMSAMLHTLSYFNISHPELTKDLLLEILKTKNTKVLEIRSICNILWSVAVVSRSHLDYDREVICTLISTLQRKYEEGLEVTKMEGYNQIYESLYTMGLRDQISGDLAIRSKKTWMKTLERPKTVSYMHSEIADILKGLDIAYTLEDTNDELSKDIVINSENQKIAIEVHGIYHYPRNSTTLLGGGVLKKRLLESLNWTVIEIPYYEWTIIEKEKRKMLIRDLLASCMKAQ